MRATRSTKHEQTTRSRGSALVLVLVFAGVFVVGVGALFQFVLRDHALRHTKLVNTQARQIAEAGLEYYKWFLAHNPTQDSEERTVPYADPQTGQRIGSFTINSVANKQCGIIQSRDITVRATLDRDTRFERVVKARYMRPSVANYSYIIGSNVWAGSTRTITGPYYSQGGIKMNATHNSLVSSAVSTWWCDESFGSECHPPTTKPGVFGSGSNPQLWRYPEPVFDFNNLDIDLSDLKTRAQADGLYFSEIPGEDNGYHLYFRSNGTVSVYRVTHADYRYGWKLDGTIERDYHIMQNQEYVGNFTIPSDCSVIFVEDQVWVNGVVNGKYTLIAADPDSTYDPDIILYDDLTYRTGDGADGLTAIAERAVLLSATSRENLTLNGIFVALGWKFGRNHYVRTNGYYWNNGWVYMKGVHDYQMQDTLTINGTIVSKGRTGTAWSYVVYKRRPWWGWDRIHEYSGYNHRVNQYERALAFDPPPFTPAVSAEHMYIRWREQ